MKRQPCLLYIALVLAWTVTATAASQRSPSDSNQQTLIELERGWNDAFYRQDVAFIETLLADEFMATYGDGSRGDKARELTLTAEFNQQV